MNEVVIQREENAIRIALSGEIHSGNADDFYREVMEAYRADKKDLHFSCRELAFIDSTTLGTFVKIKKEVAKEGNKVVLSSLQPNIKKLFLICNLDAIMEIES
ncbi:MAG: STAS domain-containing protein [Clostridia bacterium]|nr:STAS domain-containing protein [Clostridia bacterium]